MIMKKWVEMDKVERVSAVVRWAKKGMTASEIAQKIGCSRNSVIGLAHRNGIAFANLNFSDRASRKSGLDENKPKQNAKKVTRIKKTAKKPKQTSVSCEVIEFVQPTPKRSGPTHLLDLDSDDCRMPMFGDAKQVKASEYMFCGKPIYEGSSYCAECRKKTFGGYTRSGRVSNSGEAPQPVRKRKPFMRWQR